MAKLILVRHGRSEYNDKGLWTGHTDVCLTEQGFHEARCAGEVLKDTHIHIAYTSELTRAHQTLEEIISELEITELTTVKHSALNERDYGIHTGKNKWQVKEEVGESEFHKIRRSWDHPIPNGETLKDVHARVAPYFEEEILQQLKKDKNVLVVAHGNSLRALVKHLENIDENIVCELEIGTGEVYCYEYDKSGKIINKEIRAANPDKLKI